jgi:hypothetical protein
MPRMTTSRSKPGGGAGDGRAQDPQSTSGNNPYVCPAAPLTASPPADRQTFGGRDWVSCE